MESLKYRFHVTFRSLKLAVVVGIPPPFLDPPFGDGKRTQTSVPSPRCVVVPSVHDAQPKTNLSPTSHTDRQPNYTTPA